MNLTTKEMRERIKQYAEKECLFDGYYKYTFYFTIPGEGVEIAVGGDKDDIYRLSVSPTQLLKKILDECSLPLDYSKKINGEIVEEYSSY